jgi:hypothetical protein
MDYGDVYFLDTSDPRNAIPPTRAHGAPGNWRPLGRAPTAMVPATAMAPASAMMPQYSYPAAYPQTWPAVMGQYPQYVMGNPLGVPMGNGLGAIVAGLGGVGTVVDIIAQVFAAVLPLPAAPTPLGGEADSNPVADTNSNTKNLITYQSALASYAKRDEQIRTLGSLVKKLVG